jgi:hypothetical protein
VLPLTRTEHLRDLNYLFRRQQISLFMAENATSEEARGVHRELAGRYTARIAGARCPTAPLRVG